MVHITSTSLPNRSPLDRRSTVLLLWAVTLTVLRPFRITLILRLVIIHRLCTRRPVRMRLWLSTPLVLACSQMSILLIVERLLHVIWSHKDVLELTPVRLKWPVQLHLVLKLLIMLMQDTSRHSVLCVKTMLVAQLNMMIGKSNRPEIVPQLLLAWTTLLLSQKVHVPTQLLSPTKRPPPALPGPSQPVTLNAISKPGAQSSSWAKAPKPVNATSTKTDAPSQRTQTWSTTQNLPFQPTQRLNMTSRHLSCHKRLHFSRISEMIMLRCVMLLPVVRLKRLGVQVLMGIPI